jgi:hypothetical protein
VKIIILLVLLIIIGSLGSALYHLLYDRERSALTVKALTWRIGLSLGLFLLLIVAFSLGLIKPHGLRPVHDPAATTTGRPTPPDPA